MSSWAQFANLIYMTVYNNLMLCMYCICCQQTLTYSVVLLCQE